MMRRIRLRFLLGLVGVSFFGPLLAVAQKSATRQLGALLPEKAGSRQQVSGIRQLDTGQKAKNHLSFIIYHL
jgi:hypothetical protein